jgi:hypothetical protein
MANPRGVWQERCFLIRGAAMPRLKKQLIISAQHGGAGFDQTQTAYVSKWGLLSIT